MGRVWSILLWILGKAFIAKVHLLFLVLGFVCVG